MEKTKQVSVNSSCVEESWGQCELSLSHIY